MKGTNKLTVTIYCSWHSKFRKIKYPLITFIHPPIFSDLCGLSNYQASASLLVFPELSIFGSLLCVVFILCDIFCNMWLGLVVSYSTPLFKFCHLSPKKYACVIILCYLLIYLQRYLFLSFKLLSSCSLCS